MNRLLRAFGTGFRLFGEHVGVIVNTAFLTVVYFIGVGLSALLLRVSGKRMLEFGKRRTSYWSDLHLRDQSEEDCHRQF